MIEQYYHPNATTLIDNPMYNKEVGCWNESKYTSLRSTTQARFDISEAFQITAMLGLTKKMGTQDSFIPPTHKYYDSEENIEQKGSYGRGEKTESLWETRWALNYAKTTGFLTSDIDHLATSLGYPSTGGTYGSESTSRRVSLSGFCNYYYDTRYFIDLTYSLDGGSSFGKNSRFSSFYSIGRVYN